MPRVDNGPRAATAVELKRLLELDRLGDPYIVLRDASGELLTVTLPGDRDLTVGRDERCDLALPWDAASSRVHAELVVRAGAPMVVDDGTSKNGTFVNGDRVVGRRRLANGDVVQFGGTIAAVHVPPGEQVGTMPLSGDHRRPDVTPAQHRVLVALCRPLAGGVAHAVPATNRAIAEELVVGDESVKSHMHALFQRFGIEELPQNAKRLRLAELALRSGVVAPRDVS